METIDFCIYIYRTASISLVAVAWQNDMVYKNASTLEHEGLRSNERHPQFGAGEGMVMTGLLNFEGFEQRSDLSPKDKIDALTPEELKQFARQLKHELQQALKGRMELDGLFPDLENTETTLTDIEVAHDLSAELLRHVEFVQANFDTLKMYVEAYATRLRDSGSSDQLQLAQELEDLIAKIESGREATATLLRLIQSGLRRVLTAIHQIKIGHWDVFSKKGLWEKISERDKKLFAHYANSPSYVEANVKTPVEPSLARYRLSQLRGLMTGRTARKLAAGGATFAAGAIATTAMAGSDMPAQVAEQLTEADVCPDGQDNATINQIIKDLKSVLGIDVAALRDYVARCEMLLGNEIEVESPTFGGIVDGSSAGDTSTFDSQFATETETEIGTPRPEQNGAQLPQLLVEFAVDQADKETMSSHVPTEPEFVNRDQGLLWYGDLHMLEDGTTLAGLPRFNENSQLHAEIMEVAQGILQLVVDQKIMSPEQVTDQKIGLFFDNQTGQMKATIIWQTDTPVRFSNDFELPAGTVMLFNQAGEWRYLSPEASERVEIWDLEQVKPHLFSKDRQVLGTASTGKVLLIVGPNGPNEALAANNTMSLNPEGMTPLINAKTTSVNLRETPEAAGNTPVGSLKPRETAWPVPASELETLRAERGELFDAATDLDTSSGRIVANGEWVLVVEPQGRIVWVNMELVSEGEQSTNPASLVSAEATPPAPVSNTADQVTNTELSFEGVSVETISKDTLLSSAETAYESLAVPMKTPETLNPNSLVYFVDSGISFTNSNQANLTPDFIAHPEQATQLMKHLRAQTMYYLLVRDHIQRGTDGSEIPTFDEILSGEFDPEATFELRILTFQGDLKMIQFDPSRDQIMFHTLQGMSIAGEEDPASRLLHNQGSTSFADVETTSDGKNIIHIFQFGLNTQFSSFVGAISGNVFNMFLIPQGQLQQFAEGSWGGPDFDALNEFLFGAGSPHASLRDNLVDPSTAQFDQIIPLK